MTIAANAVIRSMRGESHSYLLAGDDGNYYVTKFAWRPDGHRRLINEWVGTQLLSLLGLATPRVCIVEATAAFLDVHASKLETTTRESPTLIGPHFGSQFPGDPLNSVVYDYLPDKILSRVENLDHFVGTLVFDLWCGKLSRRQAIFTKTCEKSARRLRAWMVDNGDLFGGAAWRLYSRPAPCVNISPHAYAQMTGMEDVDPWVTKIQALEGDVFSSLVAGVPEQWIGSDGPALTKLLQRLNFRRGRVRNLFLALFRTQRRFFPNWADKTLTRKRPAKEQSACKTLQRTVA